VDKTLGQQAVGRYIEHPTVQDSTIVGVLRQLDSALSMDSTWDYHLTAVDDEVVNAFALPGGPIFLHRGLLVRIETPEALAALVAHEMGHIDARHGTLGVARGLFWTLLFQLTLGDVGELGQILAQHGASLAENAYSREQERDADSLAIERLAKSGIDPRGMIGLLRILESQESHSPQIASLWSSHPLTTERIENAQRVADRLVGIRSWAPAIPPSRWEAFQSALLDSLPTPHSTESRTPH
jgi:predicted Zn-dependent protease